MSLSSSSSPSIPHLCMCNLIFTRCEFVSEILLLIPHSVSPQVEACLILRVQDVASVQAPTHFSS